MTTDPTPHVAWPHLAEPFASALKQAVDFILREIDPIGIVATGTIIRGSAHANSDLDLYAVHRAAYRRRIQRRFAGVPAEIFINPPHTVRRYFVDEDRDGRRLTAHMLATGVVIFRADAIIDDLRAEAAEWLAKDTPTTEIERTTTRYAIASQLEDAMDILEADESNAALLLGTTVVAMLEYFCKAGTGRVPRRKDLLPAVASRDAGVADLAVRFVRAAAVSERAKLAIELADRTIGARGFFEWDSGPGPAPE